ncbi:MAG: thrombospondin type 3 repeat-containing protein, partial [Deltaproteobacteria bacterium]|nr:thrombospondin type 3 repeat-containing protein [Deltaproteobacteria bacterium]
MRKLATWLLCAWMGLGLASAAERGNLSTQIETRIEKQNWTPARKAAWRAAVREVLGDVAGTVLGRDDPSVAMFMGVLVHAEKSKLAPESAVAVARAAFRAARKGAEPERLLRLATRAQDLGREATRTRDWLLGLADLRQSKIDGPVAEALVAEAIEKNWPPADFGSLKWCLVRAGRKGHDPKAFSAYLLKKAKGDRESPDRRCAKATRFFARQNKTKPSGTVQARRPSLPKAASLRPPQVVRRLSAKDRLIREQMAETVGKTRVAKPAAYKMALPLPGTLAGCNGFTRSFDMDGDGTKGEYKVVSLLECNGQNLVSLVKAQVEGSCSVYSTTAYLETLVGRKLLAARPATPDHPLADFLPVDLGEAINNYCLKPIPILAGSSLSVPKEDKSTYATLEAFLPQTEHIPLYMLFRPLKDLGPQVSGEKLKIHFENSPWFKLAKQTASHFKALSPQHCASVMPNVNFSNSVEVARLKELGKKYYDEDLELSTNEKNEFYSKIAGPYTNCIHDAARGKGLVFAVAPYPQVRETLDMRHCLDAAGKKVDCKSAEAVDFDYGKVDEEIRQFLKMGFPVQTVMNWKHWKGSEHRNVDAGSDYFFYRVTCPGDLDAFSCDKDEDNAVELADGTYCVGNGHSVLIVGYMQNLGGEDGHGFDYWIIKNSHGWSKNLKKAKIHLVATPSSTGPITEARSTKRLFYSDGRHDKYYVFKNVNFVRFGPEIQSLDDIAAEGGMLLAVSDMDKDGILDFFDNCPLKFNTAQLDGDGDWVGDVCDPCPEVYDRYQSLSNLHIHDPDHDGLTLLCDNCYYDANPDQKDSNGNGKGDACQACPKLTAAENKDLDCIAPAEDNCPEHYNPGQEDLDGDGLGDACDKDKDGDGISNIMDNCPNDSNLSQARVDSGRVELDGKTKILVPWACEDEWAEIIDFIRNEQVRKFEELLNLAKTMKKGPPPVSPVLGGSPYLRILPHLNVKVLKTVLQSLGVAPRMQAEILRVKSSLGGR